MKKLKPERGNDLPQTLQEIMVQVEDQSPVLLTSCPQLSRQYLLPQYTHALQKLGDKIVV